MNEALEPVKMSDCINGVGCLIVPFTEIQKDVTIGKYTKVYSHTFICEIVSIVSDFFIGRGIVFINDGFSSSGPARGDKNKWNPPKIGNRVSIGSNATILLGTICNNVVIGAGAVFIKNIIRLSVYAFNPAKLLKKQEEK